MARKTIQSIRLNVNVTAERTWKMIMSAKSLIPPSVNIVRVNDEILMTQKNLYMLKSLRLCREKSLYNI